MQPHVPDRQAPTELEQFPLGHEITGRGLRRKFIPTLVVTARATGPIWARMSSHTVTSASENIVGPEIVPPGRIIADSAGSRSVMDRSSTRSTRMPRRSMSGNSRARNACRSGALIAVTTSS